MLTWMLWGRWELARPLVKTVVRMLWGRWELARPLVRTVVPMLRGRWELARPLERTVVPMLWGRWELARPLERGLSRATMSWGRQERMKVGFSIATWMVVTFTAKVRENQEQACHLDSTARLGRYYVQASTLCLVQNTSWIAEKRTLYRIHCTALFDLGIIFVAPARWGWWYRNSVIDQVSAEHEPTHVITLSMNAPHLLVLQSKHSLKWNW